MISGAICKPLGVLVQSVRKVLWKALADLEARGTAAFDGPPHVGLLPRGKDRLFRRCLLLDAQSGELGA